MKNKMRKEKMPMLSLRAGFKPETFNEEKRTIDVVWTTGAKVKRHSWDGPFFEELSLKKGHVDLSRLNDGAPVLNNHSNWRLEDIIGVVESAKVVKGEGIATLRLSDNEEDAGIVNKIKNGIIRNISVGYRVNKFEERKEAKDEIPTFRAVDWTPMELSFVGIPADQGAQVRSESEENKEENEVIIETIESQGDDGMKRKNGEVVKTKTEETSPEIVDERNETEEVETTSEETSETRSENDEDEVETVEETRNEDEAETIEVPESTVEEIRASEQTRILDIRSAVKTAKLDDSFSLDLIERNVSVDEARKLIIKALEKKNNETKTVSPSVGVNDVENKELRRAAAVRGMLHRMDPSKFELKDGDREFTHDSLMGAVRHYLSVDGVRNVLFMNKHDLATRALQHSSDFPLVLADVSNKALMAGYASAPKTFEPFTKRKSAPDFKTLKSYRLSDGGTLKGVNEHGEYKRDSLKEAKEEFGVQKFGKIIGNTWELLINDDLDAFTDIPRKLGRRAAEKESEVFWNLLTQGAGNNGQIMAEDGLQLFNATHNTLGVAAVISVTSLSEARENMRTHVDLDGELISGIMPVYLVVPAALETVAQQFISQIQPDQAGNVNPFASNLRLIVEPRLDAVSATAWYMMAEKAMVDMVDMASLGGRGPEIFVREGFDVDSMETKIRYVFNSHVMDYRGFFKNAGA